LFIRVAPSTEAVSIEFKREKNKKIIQQLLPLEPL